MKSYEAAKLLRQGPEGIQEWNRHRSANTGPIYLGGIDLSGCLLCGPNDEGVNLSNCDMTSANLENAGLKHSNLHACRLIAAHLAGADIQNADATAVDFTAADLRGANLSGAKLLSAKFIGCYVLGMHVDDAVFCATTLVIPRAIDGPSDIIGLDKVRHEGPSWISVDTLRNFRNELPEMFLRGCGLRDEEIAYFRSRISLPIQYYSCFISYSASEEELAARLYDDFQTNGIRCWKWTDDARTGRELWREIDQAIRVYDKLVLIASESSLKSPAVIREIERALAREDELVKKHQAGEYSGDVNVVFPVRVDEFIFKGWQHHREVDITRKVIADASSWDNDEQKYRAVRDRLLRDLRPS